MSWQYVAVATEAAVRAGAIQLEHYGQDVKIEKKGEIDLVTEVDHACEAAILEVIRERFPEHDIVTEEADIARTGSRYVWIVDPLDGTTNFAHSYPMFCASIALTVDGESVAGAVFDPLRDELFTAEKGGRRPPQRRAPEGHPRGSPDPEPDHHRLPLRPPREARRAPDPVHPRHGPGPGRAPGGLGGHRPVATSPRDGPTPSGRRSSSPGTWPRAGCWSRRRVAGSPASTARTVSVGPDEIAATNGQHPRRAAGRVTRRAQRSRNGAGVAQLAEAADLKSAQSGFESQHQHHLAPDELILSLRLKQGSR